MEEIKEEERKVDRSQQIWWRSKTVERVNWNCETKMLGKEEVVHRPSHSLFMTFLQSKIRWPNEPKKSRYICSSKKGSWKVWESALFYLKRPWKGSVAIGTKYCVCRNATSGIGTYASSYPLPRHFFVWVFPWSLYCPSSFCCTGIEIDDL